MTGLLEHPNIVPVHDLGEGEDGRPFLVMKRIEGREWTDLMDDPDEVRRRFGVTDVQGWHLRTFIAVCHAVHYAHTQGVLHRDLKPSNVMIGSFGEVYVVDWGIAVARDDRLEWLPLAREARQPAGTPSNMAPEMLGGPPDIRTDVYLLGGLLYELLTGRAPHEAPTMAELLRSVRDEDPPSPEGPTEIVDLCRRALCRDPAGRPSSAEACRLAVQAYLEHRDAEVLLRRGEELQERLAAELAGGRDVERVRQLFAECRFALEHGLEGWPDAPDGAATLDSALALMIGFELEEARSDGADALLRAMTAPTPELVATVTTAVAREADLDRARRDLDPLRGRRIRSRVMVAAGVVWFWAGAGTWLTVGTPSRVAMLAGSLLLVVGVAILGLVGRRAMTATLYNRRAWGLLLLSASSHAALVVVTTLMGLDSLHTLTLLTWLWAYGTVVAVLTLERRLAPVAAIQLAGAMIATRHPELAMPVGGVGAGALAVAVAWVWRPQSPDHPAVADKI